MPLRDTAPTGAPCWVELYTSDPDATQAFYTELFGWTCESAGEEYGGYFNFAKDGHGVAGGMKNDGSGAPDGWSIYLAVDDAEKVAAAAPEHGGSVMLPPMEVMTLGTMEVIMDPGGAAIGGWQPGDHKGFELFGEPDSATWFELHTRAYDESVTFYRDVFHWDAHAVSDTPDFRYTTYGEDEPLAGIMDFSGFPEADEPSGWWVYFGTADIDATVARIQELGGKVVQGPDDTPYGRLAVAQDPTGIGFRLQQPPEA